MNPGENLDRRKLLRYVLQGVALGTVATVLVLVFTMRHGTLDPLRQFPPAVIALLFGMVFLAWLCNGARMWLMCRAAGHPLRYLQAIAISLSTEFGIAATPAGLGGSVIRLSLLRRAGVPIPTAASLLATDAAIDLVFFALLSPFAIHELLHDAVLRAVIRKPSETDTLFALGILLALAAGAVQLVRSERFHRLVARILAATAFGRRRRLAARYQHLRRNFGRSLRRLIDTLVFLRQRRKSALFLNLLIASIQWCCRYLLLPVILLGFGVHVNPLPLFLIQGVLFGLSLLVVAPGGGGSVELLTGLILPGLVPSELVGLTVLVWRFFTYHLYLIGGGTMFFWAFNRLDRLFPPRPAPSDVHVVSGATQPRHHFAE